MPDATMSKPAALSPREIAEALSMSRRQIYRWMSENELSSTKIDGRHKITESQLAGKVGGEMAAEVFDRAAEARQESE